MTVKTAKSVKKATAAKKPAAKAKATAAKKPAAKAKTAADKKSVKGFLAQVREAALQSEFYSEAFNALDELLEKGKVNGADVGAFTQKVFLLGVAAGTEASIL